MAFTCCARPRPNPTSWGRGSPVPLYLRDPTHLFSAAPCDEAGLYVALGASTDADEGRVSDFLAGVLARIARDKLRYVVLDFRMNGGGDYTRTYPFMAALV